MNTPQDSLSLKLLLPLLASIVAVSPLSIDIYLPAMPLLARVFDTDMPAVQNSLSVYLLGYALGLATFGPLADKYSKRTLVFIGLGGFAVMSLCLPIVTSINEFIVVRFFQAFISSAATVVVPATIRNIYKEHSAKGLSYVSMIMMIAPMIAPSIGSLLLLHSWQLMFYVLATYSLVILCFAYRYFPSDTTAPTKTSVGFIERYKIVFSCKKARLYILTSMFISFAFFTYITAIPFIYLTVFSTSEVTFSVLFAINIIGLMLAHFINTRCVVRYGSRKMLALGLIVAVIFASLLLLVTVFQLPIVFTVVSILPLMGSISIIAVNSDALILNALAKQSGTATAVIGILRFGIGALAGPLLAISYNGSALPFAFIMWSAVIFVLFCQFIVVHQLKQQQR
jgi:DHA1 family bicyclomycin/chloramphenicol resistance-like MFS transporter